MVWRVLPASRPLTNLGESALCDGPQALVGSDLREPAAAARKIPPLLGRVDAGDRVRAT